MRAERERARFRLPAGQGGNFMKQFAERGLDKSGMKVIAEGSLTEDDIVNQIGDAALGAWRVLMSGETLTVGEGYAAAAA